MVEYIVLLLLMTFGYASNFARYGAVKEGVALLYYVLIISIILLIGLRGLAVGTDTYHYYQEYEHAEYIWGRGGRPTEFLFNFILKVARSFDLSFTGFNLVYGGYTVFALGRLTTKSYNQKILLIFLYYTLGVFGMSLTGMRQMIAVFAMVLAYRTNPNSARVAIIILVQIAAVLIHNTAAVCLPLTAWLIFRSNKIGPMLKIAIIAISALAIIYLTGLDFNSIIDGKIYNYVESEDLRRLNVLPAVFWIMVCIYSMWLNYQARRIQKSIQSEAGEGIIPNDELIRSDLVKMASLMMIGCYLLALEFPLFDRLAYYFKPLIFASISYHLTSRAYVKYRNLQLGVVFLVCGGYFLYTLTSNGGGIVPYAFGE